MHIIETARLRLIALTHELLQEYLRDRPAMERSLGLQVSAMQIEPMYQKEIEDALIHFWIPMTLEHQEKYQWYTNWEIILKSTNSSIGGIGFTGYPDASGLTEVGFMLDELVHGKGYGYEALKAMVDWAFTDANTKSVTARTLEDNSAAQKLLERVGFRREAIVDGLIGYKLPRNL